MHKITKEEAREFVLKQNYEIILSTKLSNYTIDDNDYDTIYFPIPIKEFIKEIEEEEIVWTSEGEILGYWDDWKELLDNLVQSSEETEEEFCLFCAERDIDWKDYVDESDLSTQAKSKILAYNTDYDFGSKKEPQPKGKDASHPSHNQ